MNAHLDLALYMKPKFNAMIFAICFRCVSKQHSKHEKTTT